MIVFSPIALYTTFIAWKHNNLVFEALSELGLVFIGFVMVAWHFFRDVTTSDASSGSMDRHRNQALWSLIMMYIAFVSCVYPVVPLKVSELKFTPHCFENSKNVEPSIVGKSGTTYDETLLEAVSGTVKIPYAFHLAQKLTSSATYALMATAQCKDGFNDIKSEILSTRLPDGLKKELYQFKTQCYDIARMKFASQKPELSKYKDDMASGGGEIDLTWMGSKSFTNLYYKDIHSKDLKKGYTLTESQKKSYEATTGKKYNDEYGYPTCNQWWNDKGMLLDKIVKAADYNNGLYKYHNQLSISSRLLHFFSSKKADDNGKLTPKEILARILLHYRGTENLDSDNYLNINGGTLQKYAGSWFLKGSNMVKSVGAGVKSEALKQVLPIFNAGVYLIIVVVAPIFIVFSFYRFSVIKSFLVTICLLIFINYIWTLLGYFERSIVSISGSQTFNQYFEMLMISLYFLSMAILFSLSGLLGAESGAIGRSDSGVASSEVNSSTSHISGIANTVTRGVTGIFKK